MTCARIISNMDKLLINTRTFKERKGGIHQKQRSTRKIIRKTRLLNGLGKHLGLVTYECTYQRWQCFVSPRPYVRNREVTNYWAAIGRNGTTDTRVQTHMYTCPWGMMFFYIDCEKQKRQCCLHIKCYQPNYIYLKNNYTRASCIIWPTV